MLLHFFKLCYFAHFFNFQAGWFLNVNNFNVYHPAVRNNNVT